MTVCSSIWFHTSHTFCLWPHFKNCSLLISAVVSASEQRGPSPPRLSARAMSLLQTLSQVPSCWVCVFDSAEAAPYHLTDPLLSPVFLVPVATPVRLIVSVVVVAQFVSDSGSCLKQWRPQFEVDKSSCHFSLETIDPSDWSGSCYWRNY